jgi:competence protein ComEC
MAWSELKSLAGKHPLLWLALAALGGILIADGQPDLIWPLGITASVFLLIAWRKASYLALSAVMFCLFGALHCMEWRESFSHPLRERIKADGELDAIVIGRFISAPVVDETTSRPEIVFEAEEIKFATKAYVLRGRTKLSLSGRPLQGDFKAHGGRYAVEGKLQSPSSPLNPTTYDRTTAQLRKGIVGFMKVSKLSELGEEEFSLKLWLLTLAERSRLAIAKALAAGIEDDVEAVTLIRTMALGTAERDTAQMAEPFRNSGTLHVFAVSGLHVGLIGVIGWMGLKMCRLRRGQALFLLIPLVFGYAFITGWRASAARAAFMMAVMVLAPLLKRHGRICNALGLAALLLWAADTHQTYDAGFQLSFLVLMAIAVGSHLLAKPLLPWARLDDYLPLPIADWSQRFMAKLREGVIMLFATSAAAWIGSTPLTVGHFGSITVVALIANVLLVPLSFLSLSCVALSLIASGLGLTSVQHKLNHANLFWAHSMTYCAEKFSAVPGGNTMLGRRKPGPDDPPQLYLPALGPGQGGQLLVADGKGWWLDCGGENSYDYALKSIIVEAGLTDFKGMVLSHSDSQHVGSAERLFKRYPMDHVKLPIHEPWPYDTIVSVLAQLTQSPLWKSKTVQHLQAGDNVLLGKGVVMEVLYPSGADQHDTSDDRTLVARILLNNHRVLWVSDAGFIVEKDLLERLKPEQLQADILLRGQHASDLSALPEFLASVKPKIVITANYPSVEGETIPFTLTDYCQKHGVRIIELQQDGMTHLVFEEERVRISTQRTQLDLELR